MIIWNQQTCKTVILEVKALTKIFYVRHAEPNYQNHDDATRELSPKGMQDRKLVTQFLMDKEIDIAVSSPFKRAIDTIKEFTDLVDLEIEIIDEFRERRVDSVWIDDFESFSRKQWRDFSFKLSDGECLREVQERNIAALSRLIKKYRGKNIVIGGHGTALGTILNYYSASFGYESFADMKGKMPWIVELHFDEGENCCSIHKHDLY